MTVRGLRIKKKTWALLRGQLAARMERFSEPSPPVHYELFLRLKTWLTQ